MADYTYSQSNRQTYTPEYTVDLLRAFNEQLANKQLSTKKAVEWYQKMVNTLKETEAGKVGTQMMKERQKLVPRGQLSNQHIGRMVMFYYDAKWRAELPYYDKFPLVLPLKFYTGEGAGFLGINLHYLPINLRATLLDRIYQIYKAKHFDENKKLTLTYELLNSSSRYKYFKPCLKRYLYKPNNKGNPQDPGMCVRSQFYIIDPNEWNMMLTLPTERFVKHYTSIDAKTVWKDSQRKVSSSGTKRRRRR